MRLVLARDPKHEGDWGVWDLYTKDYPLFVATMHEGCLFGKKSIVWCSFTRLVHGEPLRMVTQQHDSNAGHFDE